MAIKENCGKARAGLPPLAAGRSISDMAPRYQTETGWITNLSKMKGSNDMKMKENQSKIRKNPTREELDKKDCWRLEDLYASDQEWEQDALKMKEQLAGF